MIKLAQECKGTLSHTLTQTDAYKLVHAMFVCNACYMRMQCTYEKYRLHVSVGVVILRAKYNKSRFAYRTLSALVRIARLKDNGTSNVHTFSPKKSGGAIGPPAQPRAPAKYLL